jgi:P27 family predicted phage terminase small subunit
MAARGPKRKPTALKLVSGNPGHRKLPKNEPKLAPQLPACPTSFDDSERGMRRRRAWSDLAQILLGMRVLTVADAIALEIAAIDLARVREADEHLQVEGEMRKSKRGTEYVNPWTGVLANAEKKLWNALACFGMTPADRSKVSTVGDDQQENAFGQF